MLQVYSRIINYIFWKSVFTFFVEIIRR